MTRTTFAKAARMQPARTQNDMKAVKSTGGACMDLFYNIGASRGKNIIPMFSAAFNENAELAVRIALWARDARKGAGERQVFKDILVWLSANHPTYAARAVTRVPELGRWDDVLVTTGTAQEFSFDLIKYHVDRVSAAKDVLNRLDNLTEKQCSYWLNYFHNVQNENAS